MVIFCVSTVLRRSRMLRQLEGNATCAMLLSNLALLSNDHTRHGFEARHLKIYLTTYLTTIVIPALPWKHSMLYPVLHFVHVNSATPWGAMLMQVGQFHAVATMTSMLGRPLHSKTCPDPALDFDTYDM